MEPPPPKRQRLESEDASDNDDTRSTAIPQSLLQPISPPQKRKRTTTSVLPSPWQLTWIRDLPESSNQDAVTLKDLLGDPLISECWEFNFLHDIGFLMDAFDQDTRHIVKVHVVHGFWKREDPNRLPLVEEASMFDNVELHAAPMPEMFGTHHSKMMVLFRHDETAQVIVHTANMIPKDWTNMTNAVWKSPLLPLADTPMPDGELSPEQYPVGSGDRFKVDLLNYLRAYDSHRVICKPMIDRLRKHDFAAVRGALVASVPGRHHVHDVTQTAWGWAALKRNLAAVPCRDGDSEVVVQVSSIATLGGKDDWLRGTLLASLSRSSSPTSKRPRLSVVFPTADEIRQCLDGYMAGASIHTRIQSAQQSKQLEYLRPMLHHWANDSPRGRALPTDVTEHDGGRARAAPHIKTYVRYSNKDRSAMDWALLTSANLSKQAWGEAMRPTGEIRVSSWEVGVMVWPELIAPADSEGGCSSIMVPTFRSDTPSRASSAPEAERVARVAGVRIPYSLPLQRYGDGEIPWVTSMAHTEPDRYGATWGV